MLWWLRLAGVIGLLLALADVVWVLADAPGQFREHVTRGGRVVIDATVVAKELRWLLEEMYRPCSWFGLAGILYALADIASLKRAHHDRLAAAYRHRPAPQPPQLATAVFRLRG
jgi:hypothetical protein